MNQPAIRRGDIWMVDWPQGQGSEQRGFRPSLVIQNDAGNARGRTTIIAAITTSPRDLPVVVPIGTAESVLAYESYANLSQVQTVDKSRLVRKIGSLGLMAMRDIDDAIRVSLGLITIRPP